MNTEKMKAMQNYITSNYKMGVKNTQKSTSLRQKNPFQNRNKPYSTLPISFKKPTRHTSTSFICVLVTLSRLNSGSFFLDQKNSCPFKYLKLIFTNIIIFNKHVQMRSYWKWRKEAIFIFPIKDFPNHHSTLKDIWWCKISVESLFRNVYSYYNL